MRKLLLLVALTVVGCSRPFWRDQADREVYPIIGERVLSPSAR